MTVIAILCARLNQSVQTTKCGKDQMMAWRVGTGGARTTSIMSGRHVDDRVRDNAYQGPQQQCVAVIAVESSVQRGRRIGWGMAVLCYVGGGEVVLLP
jgi:hypothetical protein